MRYIRFLKTPRVVEEKNASKSHIYCLITITSDLGDSFLPYDISLSAELHSSEPPDQVLVWRTAQWTSGMRILAIRLPLSNSRPGWPLRVRVGAEVKAEVDDFSQLLEADSRGVVSAWSAPLDPTRGIREAVKLVERIFAGCNGKPIRVWEETGESIARHLWDAGITSACHINGLLGKAGMMPAPERLRVLELGTGCVLVGVSIAQGVENAEVILTDLSEAEEIIERNIKHARPAKGSSLRFLELDWDSELPKGLRTCPIPYDSALFDIILAADCTYNPDSSPALVNTFHCLAKMSPGVVIIIAMKKRHNSEEIFFELMSEAGFKTKGVTNIPLPGDEQRGEETVYVYMYRWEGGNNL